MCLPNIVHPHVVAYYDVLKGVANCTKWLIVNCSHQRSYQLPWTWYLIMTLLFKRKSCHLPFHYYFIIANFILTATRPVNLDSKYFGGGGGTCFMSASYWNLCVSFTVGYNAYTSQRSMPLLYLKYMFRKVIEMFHKRIIAWKDFIVVCCNNVHISSYATFTLTITVIQLVL